MLYLQPELTLFTAVVPATILAAGKQMALCCGAFLLPLVMQPKQYLPVQKPVEALQYTGENWNDILPLIGNRFQKLVPQLPHKEGAYIVCFTDWSCDLNPTDWVVKYATNDVIIMDHDSFCQAYSEVV